MKIVKLYPIYRGRKNKKFKYFRIVYQDLIPLGINIFYFFWGVISIGKVKRTTNSVVLFLGGDPVRIQT